MKLELSETEARELETALNNHLVELRMERAHTDSRAFRHDLSDHIDALEAIVARLTERSRASA